MWWLAIFLMQDASGQQQRIRAAMAESIAKQRASVEQQLRSIKSPVPLSESGTPSFAVPPPVVPACDPVSPPELSRMIDGAAREHSIDPALVREVARQESGFHRKAPRV